MKNYIICIKMKLFSSFLKNMVGIFCATCAATSYLCLLLNCCSSIEIISLKLDKVERFFRSYNVLKSLGVSLSHFKVLFFVIFHFFSKF